MIMPRINIYNGLYSKCSALRYNTIAISQGKHLQISVIECLQHIKAKRNIFLFDVLAL